MAKAALKVVSSPKLTPVAGDTPISFGGYRIFNVMIPVSEFLSDFRDNANQRDTELRSTKHLLPVQPEHLEVACMMTMTGEKILLNGHTRRLFWLKNPAIAPASVRMTVFEIVDPALSAADEELRLYSSFDSRSAVKTSAHTMQGTMRSVGMSLTTPWLRAGNYANALSSAATFCGISSDLSTSELMNEFRDEILAFDSIFPKKGEFVSPLTAAALIMLRKAPKQHVLEVLASYQEHDMSKMLQNGANHSIYKLMRDYRKAGASDTGRFPTNHADMVSAVVKFSKFIYMALTMGETTMIAASSFKSFPRARLIELTVDAKKIVAPV